MNKRWSRVALWGLFGILLGVIGYTALKACVLTLPYLGTVVSNCPDGANLASARAMDHRLLLDELERLEFRLARLQECEFNDPRDELKKLGVQDPPEINEAAELIVILDTSGSMGQQIPTDPTTKQRMQEITQDLARMYQILEAHKEGRSIPGTQLSKRELAEVEQRFKAREKDMKKLLDDAAAAGVPMIRRSDLARSVVLSLLETKPDDLPVSVWGSRAVASLLHASFPAARPMQVAYSMR